MPRPPTPSLSIRSAAIHRPLHLIITALILLHLAWLAEAHNTAKELGLAAALEKRQGSGGGGAATAASTTFPPPQPPLLTDVFWAVSTASS
ncbi:hypothetical protein HK104_009047, partial [Borealophlyctis nickersoniae]